MADKTDDEENTNLPKIHRNERENTPLDRLKEIRAEMDGPMSVSNAHVPDGADDIGDVDERANPRAEDLDYIVGGYCTMEHHDGEHSMFDGPNEALSNERIIRVDDDTFIEDVSCWA